MKSTFNLTAQHVIQSEPKPVSARVLIRFAQRVRMPGAQYVECIPAIMTIGRLWCLQHVLQPTKSDRCRAFWSRMVARFAHAEIVESHRYYSGSSNEFYDADGLCLKCREHFQECKCGE